MGLMINVCFHIWLILLVAWAVEEEAIKSEGGAFPDWVQSALVGLFVFNLFFMVVLFEVWVWS